MTIQFVAGRTYYGRSICDSACVYNMLVLARTPKTITIEMNGARKTLRPYLYRDVEHVRPNGNYSMALSIGADREVPVAATGPMVVGPARELPRSEAGVRRLVRAHATGANLEEMVEAVTMEGDTITCEVLRLEDVTL